MSVAATPAHDVPAGLGEAIASLLYREADALDDGRWEDWLAMLTGDYEYVVPVPHSREDPDQPRYSERSVLAWESRGSLEYRVRRLSSEFAWSDRPAAFTRHFVSNIQVEPGGHPGEWTVRSNVLVFSSRLPEEPSISSARRIDTVRSDASGRVLLARRRVLLDTESPTSTQLAQLY